MNVDRFGVEWKNIPDRELCPVCGQPDSCGDCNHQQLRDKDVQFLKGEVTEDAWKKE